MTKLADRILWGTDPEDIVAAVKELAGESMDEIESSLSRALSGERSHVRVYIHAFRTLNDRMLDAIKAQSELPTSAAVESLRELIPSLPPLPALDILIRSDLDLDDRQVARFFRAVIDELQEEHDPLGRLQIVMGLNETELARLFGVSRQAVSRWHDGGVPAAHSEKLATVGEIADLLSTQLKPERIPGVVRRSSPAYGGRTILDAIAADDQDRVLSELREAFDWSVAA